MVLLLTDSLLDGAPCGFVSFADDGTMLEVNVTLAEMLGYSRFELEGWHLQKILPPGARVFYNTHVFPILKMHGRAEEIYLALRTKDGRDVPMLMNAMRRERGGRTVNDTVFVRMLQRHEYEDQLLQARRLADEASDAKAKFLSMMSHDLRTPLTAIRGSAELLSGGYHGDLTAEQQEEVLQIAQAARELGQLLNDILSFAQAESGKVEVRRGAVPVRAAVARAERLLRLRVQQATLTLASECSESDVVLADADRLQQILLNLLTNAIKFTPPGGRVSVSCEHHEGRIRIRVCDTGVGIAPEQIDRIFDPFVQLDPATSQDDWNRGVGLGLAISRDLAHAMDGELTAESRPGEGSVFTLELPSADAGVFA